MYQWSDNLSARVSEEQTLKHEHSWGGCGLQRLRGTRLNKVEQRLVNVSGCRFSRGRLNGGVSSSVTS